MSDEINWDEFFLTPCKPPEDFSLDYLYIGLNQLPVVNQVFRLEHPEGYGPYAVTDKDWQKTRHVPATGRPTPNSDDGFRRVFYYNPEIVRRGWFDQLRKSEERNILFGFSSMKQLLRWFHHHEELMELFKLGFQIKIYNNVKALDSGSQVIFFTNKINS